MKYKDTDVVFITIPLSEQAAIATQYGVSESAVCIINPDGFILSVNKGNVDLPAKLKEIFLI